MRWKEHGTAIISQHYEHCQEPLNCENFEPVVNMQGKKKKKLAYDMRVREALEIRRHGSGPGKGLNEDNGAYLKTDIWDTVLNSIGK